MGGRGASSGVSTKGSAYGSQYRTVLSSGNIKFVTKVNRQSEALMETMTRGRVYVTVGGDDLLSIVYMDNSNKRVKTIDMEPPHKKLQPHTHHGYLHNENDSAFGAAHLTGISRIHIFRCYPSSRRYAPRISPQIRICRWQSWPGLRTEERPHTKSNLTSPIFKHTNTMLMIESTAN